ncbi:MAG TPA: CHRD domain-containing protein [Actinomycetota bacterium]|nr:CHRD domain-containing protein [Actinomycetota bacterium]
MGRRIGVVTAAVVVGALALYGVAQARHGALQTRMNGAQEVNAETGEPGAGDPDGTGSAKIRLHPEADQICFKLTWSNIGSPHAAHIHEAAAGSNGGVVVGLFTGETPLPSTISGVNGCASGVDDGLSDRIRNNPAGFYVNVHNEEYPGGAIRGQLKHTPKRR